MSKQSKEHYVSDGLWKNKTITIKGFDWLLGEEKTIPLPSFASNVT